MRIDEYFVEAVVGIGIVLDVIIGTIVTVMQYIWDINRATYKKLLYIFMLLIIAL